jgi:diguanylate cyclase (GGDEF)-like protein
LREINQTFSFAGYALVMKKAKQPGKTDRGFVPIGTRIEQLIRWSVAIAVLAIASIVLMFQLNSAISDRRKNTEATAYVLAATVADAVIAKDKNAAAIGLASVSRIPGSNVASVRDLNGAPLATAGTMAVLESDLSNQGGFLTELFRGHLSVSVDIVKGGKKIGQLALVSDISQTRNDAILVLLLLGVSSFAASLMGVYFTKPLKSAILLPLQNLTSAIVTIREKRDYSQSVEKQSNDETGILVQSFNELMQDIRMRDEVLREIAYVDTLTGLPNRASFMADLAELTKTQTTAAVLILDVDTFSSINNFLGHGVGDAVLLEVAAKLKAEAPNVSLSRVYRAGGDDFAIVIPGVATRDEVIQKYAHFASHFNARVKVLSHLIHLGCSTGVVMLPADSQKPDEILRFASLALDSAKRQGANRIAFFEHQLNDALRERSELVEGLRIALATDGLEVHYQPIVAPASNCVVGFEALCRWKHPVRGYISPAVFIPIAEKAGLIPQLGEWVLRQSCMQAKRWLDETGTAYEISVNVSAAQVLEDRFVDVVTKALADSALPPSQLCIELTESMFVGTSTARVKHHMDSIKNLGIRTALDDFGTGYSSLSYLHELPFNKLKIDRTFLVGIHGNQKRKKLFADILGIARNLELECVAEGAETLEDIELLKTLGVDLVQGYFYSKPKPAEAALAKAQGLGSVGAPVKIVVAG